ncbi:hypothetical protein [Stenotrophomonas maltophilia]|uniref:hypothetical protein n=1 Tax=Stenotrophomonas maltophilia TaxID=40324 RepID=UPI0002B8C5DB|nr:hypothetical protein [Stenotrophomonas maltophilia]EMF61241.1 Hypothetical protein EPM1_2047 [Stenotrophomonas maltophilia EPM1]KWV49521.1 hypothetical protein AS591_11910 [Stenotrophomonas maltophilia]MBA0461553.1 hypothetical protein [Stenotrophomonas maltophilia]MBC8773739.1 hypothetical protein [Stenotrophomonas maltophilia]MBH1610206.1 hypothetical protein [Stenotrophomonas maltophilia]
MKSPTARSRLPARPRKIGSEVRIFRRYHQYAIVAAGAGPLAILLFAVAPELGPLPALGAAAIFTLSPLILGFVAYSPQRDRVVLEQDRLVFQHRPPLPFKQIRSYNLDDHVDLILIDGPSVLLQRTRASMHDFPTFRDALAEALADRPANAAAAPQRRHFFGAWPARVWGAGLLLATAALVITGVLHGWPLYKAPILGIVPVVGIGLLLSRRRH